MKIFETQKISFAPLQGFTDRVYRKVFAQHFQGIDKFFIPYIEYQNDGSIKLQHQREIQPIEDIVQVPQVLCNIHDHLFSLANYLKDYGYKEVNWNLGCPYPMVAKRKKGSGLLPNPSEIEEILTKWYQNPPLELSIKLRLGYENANEIFPVIEVMNLYPIKEIILHPRIGKELYKGKADLVAFQKAQTFSDHLFSYNGDIDSPETFQNLSSKIDSHKNWMIGRGLLSNPFLAEEIKSGKLITNSDKKERLKKFVVQLWDEYEQFYGHPNQPLNKMKQQWIYLANSFENPRKVFKAIKKSSSLEKYNVALELIFNAF